MSLSESHPQLKKKKNIVGSFGDSGMKIGVLTALHIDLFSQNARQVARELKEIWLIDHFKNQ